MIVTIVCDVLGHANNGTTLAALNLIDSLRRKGHTVRVVCPDEERRGQEGFYIVPRYSLGPLDAYVASNGVTLAKPDKAVLTLALKGADVAHMMTPFALCRAAVQLCLKMGIPVTAGFHCQAENFSTHLFLKDADLFNRLLYQNFYQHLFRYCTAIHYPSKFICELFEKQVGPTPHHIISNGVDKSFRPLPAEKPAAFQGRFVVLFTGRYSREKSHKLLIRGVKASRHQAEIQLIFAGSGPREKAIRRYAARRLTNAPLMKFFTHEELLQVINYSDLYVHPAEIEIEAIACLEAIACGKVPLIANSPRSATRFFALDERNLFQNRDAHDLAAKLDWWIEHPDEIQACSKRYLGYAEHFDREHCMDEMEKMLVSAAGSGQGKEAEENEGA